MKEKSSSHP